MLQTSTIKRGFLALTTIALLSSCGSESSWIEGATVSSEKRNDEVFAKVSTQFRGNGLIMPYIALDIINPDQPREVLGHFTMAQVFGQSGRYEMSIAVNASRLIELPNLRGGSATLPNGHQIPVAGIDRSNLAVLNVRGSDIKIYVDLSVQDRSAMLGAAIPLKEFGKAGRYAPGASIFPEFRMENGVSGVFGVFTSHRQDKNGIAAFIDASSLLSQLESPFFFHGSTTDSKREEAVMKSLYKLRGQKLHVN